MGNEKVSVIIPAREEVYLQPTIDTIIEKASGDVEVVPIIDGYEPNPPIVKNDHTNIITLKKSIGQRAGYNLGVRESTGKYIMKLDGHAMVGEGFDKHLKQVVKDVGEKTTVVPEMRRLDVIDWKPKSKGMSRFMYFGTDLFCHYWREYKRRPGAKERYPELLTGQGSCWFLTREWNDYIELLDEKCGSWGKVGIEVSLKTWLQGGTQRLCKDTFQAHWFRVSDGGFPYPMDGRNIRKAREYARKNWYFNDNAFGEKQTQSFRWLIEKFHPVPGWEPYMTECKKKRAIVYYTNNHIEDGLFKAVQRQIEKAIGDFMPIISVSQKKINFGNNICVGQKERSYVSLYEQLLKGLESTDAEIIYICEHDVFYHSSHFAFIPDDREKMYYNQNNYYWKVGNNGYLPGIKKRKALSQCVCYRDYLIWHVKRRLEDVKRNPDAKLSHRWGTFNSEKPNIDVRHGHNFTGDGPYKTKYYKEKSKDTVFNIGFWGSVPHMMKKVKYKGFTRTDIINHLIGVHNYSTYLEIGVRDGKNFRQVNCESKVGVDPAGNCDLKMTSDEFFEKSFRSGVSSFDLIFIDGLHESDQVKRDLKNSFKLLSENGTIVMHDCKPENEDQQLVPKRDRSKIWTGDVWKAFAWVRSLKRLRAYVVDTNNGVGVLRFSDTSNTLEVPENLDWNYFKENKKEILNLISVDEFKVLEAA